MFVFDSNFQCFCWHGLSVITAFKARQAVLATLFILGPEGRGFLRVPVNSKQTDNRRNNKKGAIAAPL
jgi:hypothetical protein